MTPTSRQRFGRRSITGLVLILVLMSSAAAVWDYLRVQGMTRDLAIREAHGLVYQVEQELENAAVGERTVREYLTDHLFGVAYLVDRMAAKEGSANLDYDAIAAEASVYRIDLLNRHAKRVAGTYRSGLPARELMASAIDSLDTGLAGEENLGFYRVGKEALPLYGVAVARPTGGAVVVSLRAEDLLKWREQAGLGAILQHLEKHPEVAYALLENSQGILAATSDLPAWVGGPDDPFMTRAQKADGFAADFATSPQGTVFEAFTPLPNLSGVVLRLGVRTVELNQIRRRSLLGLMLRTGLFIILAALILAYFITREHKQALAEEAERIRREVERLEAERSARDRLEAMGKLAGGVAHEIRNPLNTVGMVAQRLAVEFQPEADGEEYRELLRTMREETGRIGRIIEDFLAFARPPKADKKVQDLNAVLGEAATLFRPSADVRQVEFVTDFQPISPFAFDAGHVAQAVNNLLRNALEAVQEQGGRIVLATRDLGDEVAIDVSDNGPGIPDEEKVRIFHLYYTTKSTGTGIGLPLVHRIADEHGGGVDVEETPGGGATLCMYLKKEKA